MNLRLKFPDPETWTYIAIISFGLICITLLNSCGSTKEMRRANRAERKLERLVQKFPELNRTDTIRDTLLFTVPKIEYDTLILRTDSVRITDTIRVSKDRWRTKIVFVGDTVKVSGGCDTVTVKIPYEVPCDTIQPTRFIAKPLKWWQVALMFLGAVFIGVIVFRRVTTNP